MKLSRREMATRYHVLLVVLLIFGSIQQVCAKENDHPKLFSEKFNFVREETSKNKKRVVMELYNDVIPFADEIEVEVKHGKLVQALVPVEKLNEVKKHVKSIREPVRVIPLEIVSEGVGVINATELHNLNITGEGVKVAVIDVGFYGWDSNPEIWNVEEIKSFRSDGSVTADKHGTGCAEIILDVAPNASLYLYTVSTDVELLEAIDYAISKGVDVISMSLGLLNAGGYDGTGPVCEKVNEAHDSGIFFVVAAGNFAPYHYEGNFTDNDSDGFHEFSGDDEVLEIGTLGADQDIEVFLSWYDWPYSDQDYDTCLVKWNSSISDWDIIGCSENLQNGTQEPTEYISYKTQSSGEYGVIIYNFSANESVHFDLFVLSSGNVYLEYNSPEGSISIPADAEGAFAVGAIDLEGNLEYFSSRGPTNDGRIKPDAVAPDGVSSYTYGEFYGTSASTPHVAGAAALLLSYNSSLTPDELESILKITSVDLGESGMDNLFGAGKIDVFRAYQGMKGIFYADNTTLNSVLDYVRDGNTIVLKDGIYAENINLTTSVNLISENGSENCIFIPLNPSFPVFRINANNVSISGLTFSNSGCAIIIENVTGFNLTNNVFIDNICGIRLNNSDGSRIADNLFLNSGEDIVIENSENNEFENNTFGQNCSSTLSFIYSGNMVLKEVSDLPEIPDGYLGTARCIKLENMSKNSWIYLNMSYSDSDIVENEVTLKIWKYNGSWYEDGWNGSRFLDIENNTVGVNVTTPCKSCILTPLTENTLPPPSITNLTNYTGNFWINWTWDNPDFDFNHTIIFIDNEFYLNTSLSFCNLTTSPHRTHTISIRTVDEAGNINLTWINQTTTVPNNPPVLIEIQNLTVFENQTVLIELNASDEDGDNLTFSCNRTDLFSDFNNSTGKGNWTPRLGDAGIYFIDFGVSDSYGGIDNITVIIEVYDLEPPASVSGVKCETGTDYINCSWVNPSDSDFSHVMVYLNGKFMNNVTSSYFKINNLNSGTTYEIGMRTVDVTGLINTSWVNITVQTKAKPVPARRTGGSGGGGVSIITLSPLESDAEVKQTEVRYFKSGKQVVILPSEKIADLTGLKELRAVSDYSSILTVTLAAVERFKGLPSGYSVYKMFEIVFSNNGIPVKNIACELVFKVSRDFAGKYSIQLLRYNGSSEEWERIEVDRTSEDDDYIYYTANVTSFSVFSIAGVKKRTIVTPTSKLTPVYSVTSEREEEQLKSDNDTVYHEKQENIESVTANGVKKKLGNYQFLEFFIGIVTAFILRVFTINK